MVDGEDDRGRPALADRRDVPDVYQAAEDSRLLAEAAVDDVDAGDLVLEVGTGSGYVAARLLEETGATVIGSDLNPSACRQAADAGVPTFRGNLLDPVRSGSLDAVVFNPPYLPTVPDDEWDDPMEAALSGGETGRAVVEPFLDDVGRVLRPGGRALVLVSTLTDVDEVRAYARERGLIPDAVADESYPFERLVVLRIQPGNN